MKGNDTPCPGGEFQCTLPTQDDEYERKLRSYQQQYEQLRLQYEERQAKLEGAGKQRLRNKELEQQVWGLE